jgi:hypothetical protein
MRPAGSVILLALLASGCGSGPELAVHGVVTLDGVPLDGAAVTFYPEEKAGGTGGSARTGTDGKFVLVGPKRQAGLPPGKYKVTVSKLKGGPVTDEPVLAAVTEAEAKNDLPAIYSNPAETILSFSVTGDGKPIEIPLRSKPKK